MKTIDQIRRERLLELIKAHSTQRAFAESIDKSPSQVSQWLNQSKNSDTGKPRKMSDEIAREIEISCGKPLGWMDQDSDTNIVRENAKPYIIHSKNVEYGPVSKGKIPLISRVQAGEACEATMPYAVEDVEQWMDCPVAHSPGTFALRVRGDSMTAPTGNGRTYPEGCIIFIDPEKRSPVNGERIVALIEGASDTTFKVYKNEDGKQWLAPLNPMHQTIHDKFVVLGTVIGKWEDG